MKNLKEKIEKGIISPIYLFYGEEEYLKKIYEKKIKNLVVSPGMEMMNLNIIEGKDLEINFLMDTCETLPFMAEKRLIIIKNSQLFKAGRKDDTEKICTYLSKLPESSCILFIEEEIDKRGKLYKTVQKQGSVTEFIPLKENELVTWVKRELKNSGKEIESKDVIHMLRTVGTDMELIFGEIEKLVSYTDKNIIISTDIDSICTKSLETKIFDMLDAIGEKRTNTALDIYNNLLMIKESPIKILTMIVRQFRLLFQTKSLVENGMGTDFIAQRLGQRTFVITGLVKQAKNFSKNTLREALEDCLETDLSVKTGKIQPEMALELLIIKYSTKTLMS